jgi:hypothetical protein
MRRGWIAGYLTGVGTALALACSASSATQSTAFAYPQTLNAAVFAATPQIQARYPDCTLQGWTLVGVPDRFTPPPWTRCGSTVCTGLVRGHTDYRTRSITVWTGDPSLVAVVAWEGCNACRGPGTGDTGCA